MYIHGKRIRKEVPKLPEAKGTEGHVLHNIDGPSKTLITIGESTIAGVGADTHEDAFTGTLAKELSEKEEVNIRWKVYARSGYTAAKVSDKLIPQITEKHVDYIVVGMGGNNAFSLHSPRRWRREMKSLLDNLRKKYPETPIFCTNMPPIKEFPAFTKLIQFVVGNLVELLGKELKSIVNDYDGVYYNDEIITLRGWTKKYNQYPDQQYFSDGVHPALITYQIWAKEMAWFIVKNEKKKYEPV